MRPGDVVLAAFPGAQATKTRPAVVLSTTVYQLSRPDVILGLVTTSLHRLSPTDTEIRDWRAAGLHAPSCFRLYLVTLLQRDVRVIGRLSDDDWREVRKRVEIGLTAGA